ncbi:MAG: alcohol dehydrogenase catalytic domain-containing protein [Acidobacteriia bacterium]|nr:alcohol dehydrogenase catalytic domain-containing protein [Terriglobia bacterium]
MPKIMRAAVVERFREPLVMRELPVPTPGPGQALVEIIASGVCHTDLHAADGDWPVKPNLPITPGHEGAGITFQSRDKSASARMRDLCAASLRR